MSLLIALGLAGALIQSAEPLRAAVAGRVVEQTSDTPLAGARVVLIPSRPGPMPGRFRDRPRAVLTDRDGRYEFDDVEPGRYRVVVEKIGFAPLNVREMREVVLDARERLDDVTVVLQRAAVIAGRVLDAQGEPMVRANVLAMRKPDVPPPSGTPADFLLPSGEIAQSNDLGEFRLFGLPAGEYYVQAMPGPDIGGLTAPSAAVLLPTYFPGTSDRAAAQPIRVEPGQIAGDVVIRMTAAPSFQVSGVARDERGRPVANAMVRLVRDDPADQPGFVMGRWDQARTDTSGAFTLFNVTNGTYTMLVTPPVQTSGAAGGGAAMPATGGGSAAGFAWSSGIGPGMAAGVMIESTSDGTTVQYHDDTATRVPITVNHANIAGLEVVVRPPRP